MALPHRAERAAAGVAAAHGETGTVWQQLFTRRMLICVFTGFASGLPLFLLLNLIPAWLRSSQVDLGVIGLFALIQFPYNWKFVWAPAIDRYVIPVLGRRRGWMLLTQVGLLVTIAAIGGFSPQSTSPVRVVL